MLLRCESCGVFLVSMNSSPHSSKQEVSVFHKPFEWHADPSWHISAGVFLLWLFKLLRGGQRVRLIQLRGQQARVIWGLLLQGEGKRGAATQNRGQKDCQHHFQKFWPMWQFRLLVLSTFLHLRTITVMWSPSLNSTILLSDCYIVLSFSVFLIISTSLLFESQMWKHQNT